MNKKRLQQVLEVSACKAVAVVGDVMLDRFIYGKVSRISPEAPVPVVEVLRESSNPGGAANVARNLRPFCREVLLCGVTGPCAHAAELKSLLEQEGVSTSLLVSSPDQVTTVKTRVVARQQQVVRVDRENRAAPSPETVAEILRKLEGAAPGIDAVIIEDYGKGFLSQEMVDGVIGIFSRAGKIITVDPNPGNAMDWRGVAAIKPNRAEAFAAAGEPFAEPADNPLEDEALLRVGRKLAEKWDAGCLLVTLGEHGMILFERGAGAYHIPTKAKEVFDVSGAGDTAIALFTASLAAGASPREAAEIANFASGVVVGKLGTAAIGREELLGSLPE